MLHTFFSKEKGQGLVEYVIVLTTIAMILIGSVTLLTEISSLTPLFTKVVHQPIALVVLVLTFIVAGVSGSVRNCSDAAEQTRKQTGCTYKML